GVASTTPDTTPPVITLMGVDPQEITIGGTYAELGATAVDNMDVDISSIVIDATAVDTATIGNYSVTYNVMDAAGNAATQVVRTVNVVADTVVDTTPPVITLMGVDPQEITIGGTYAELGATAVDNMDVDISIVIDATAVDTATIGNYSVTYNVMDAAGNAATQVVRTVNVTAAASDNSAADNSGSSSVASDNSGGGGALGALLGMLLTLWGFRFYRHNKRQQRGFTCED
ncbi:MAG: DUF5011 domain-containing protein, partial [Gammaproteobacteria bacterium]|nr:DUF5011 domain-containing protein [Gammaproteobacteria bacterium]